MSPGRKNNLKFMLTSGEHLGYNLKLQGNSPKGGTFYAENLSAQEAPQKKGAWIPQADVRQERTQGIGPPPCKGQGAPFLLISLTRQGRGRRFAGTGRWAACPQAKTRRSGPVGPALEGHGEAVLKPKIAGALSGERGFQEMNTSVFHGPFSR